MVPEEDTFSDLPEDVLSLSVEEINARVRMIDNEVKVCVKKSHISCVAYAQILQPGYAVREATITTRTECHEGEDPRQWREDQAE